MKIAAYRIEVYYRQRDHRGDVMAARLRRLGFPVQSVMITDNYLVNLDGPDVDINRIASMLVNPVTQHYTVNEPFIPARFDYALEVGYLPGVTDNVAHTVRESIEDLLKRKLDPETAVFSSTTCHIDGVSGPEAARKIGEELYNPLIQRISILDEREYRAGGGMGRELPMVTIKERAEADVVDLDVPEKDLLRLGKEGIPDRDGGRRGPLALDMLSLKAIQHYFRDREKRKPTDVELESIAQTWSEHCKHTIFAAKLDEIDDGIFSRFIREATLKVRRDRGAGDFCVSVFSDNSGGIEFDENFVVSDKVETHNSPSALDPFGGSITGIVGVNRDAIGFGMASKPIANRYGFCFADPFDERPLYRDRDPGSRLLPPRRIMEGVVHGVNVGGNCSGIPTPQGFIYFDERYKGKPLVFVGTVGLLPREIAGAPSTVKKAMPGDCIVMVGGRVGRDGIHGATFSSEALSSGSPATAVQIGDPITQKKLSDAIVKEARDRGLYNSITDNGAGGLSCSVAEMAREAGGFSVELDKVPLKYPGLAPWQIWVSESQERMTLSVPPERCDEFMELMEKRGVEATVIGTFNEGSRGVVTYHGEVVFDLDMGFLHDGLPRKDLKTRKKKQIQPEPDFPEPDDLSEVYIAMTGRLNTASFSFISTQYDHEVQGTSVIKPLHGKGRVNAAATVIQPIYTSYRGVALSQGLYPSYSDIDTYWMAACAIDTAVRNAAVAGASLDRLALLDNFCWCDPENPERLDQLRDAAQACYDFAVAYGAPYISGKDSMYNDFRGYDENFNPVAISVPPTLLISSIGIVEDVRKCQTLDFKFPGDVIYLLGDTFDETGGGEYLAMVGERNGGSPYVGNRVPRVDAEKNLRLYRALEEALARELVVSAVSLERGGLGVALTRSAMAGMLGAEIDLSPIGGTLRTDTLLYAESQGRVLLSVAPDRTREFEELMRGISCYPLGKVREEPLITIKDRNGREAVRVRLEACLESYRGLFKNF
ncbi:MAG TPA: phosphoribosylformylglycinamidine synthase [Spirochaetes bacterium]|nr:phosphoribosylformylglycinamidine synthase [Spirochaetota bacterium]